MSSTGTTYFRKGSWNVICDRCGEKFKSNQVKKEWTRLMVCSDCWETRHLQDFMRVPPDDMSVPFVRPRQPDHFVGPPYDPTGSNPNRGDIDEYEVNG